MFQQSLKNWEVVAEGLSTCGGGHDDEVAATLHRVVGLGLVRVQPIDSAPAQSRHELGAEAGGQLGELGGGGGNHKVQRYVPWKVGRIEAG